MSFVDIFSCFDFYDHFVRDQQVRKIFTDDYIVVINFDVLLLFDHQVAFSDLVRQGIFIYLF